MEGILEEGIYRKLALPRDLVSPCLAWMPESDSSRNKEL